MVAIDLSPRTGLIFATVFTIMGYNKPMTEPVPKNLEAAKKHEGLNEAEKHRARVRARASEVPHSHGVAQESVP